MGYKLMLDSEIKNQFIKNQRNMTEERQRFCAVNHGKTMEQIGLLIFPLTELNYDREIIYVRH